MNAAFVATGFIAPLVIVILTKSDCSHGGKLHYSRASSIEWIDDFHYSRGGDSYVGYRGENPPYVFACSEGLRTYEMSKNLAIALDVLVAIVIVSSLAIVRGAYITWRLKHRHVPARLDSEPITVRAPVGSEEFLLTDPHSRFMRPDTLKNLDMAKYVPMIEDYRRSLEFRRIANATAEENNVDCVDRSAMTLNEIYVSWVIWKDPSRDNIVRAAKTSAALKVIYDYCKNESGIRASADVHVLLVNLNRLAAVVDLLHLTNSHRYETATILPMDIALATVMDTYLDFIPEYKAYLPMSMQESLMQIDAKYTEKLGTAGYLEIVDIMDARKLEIRAIVEKF
jgi:hypothetical protein